jgi:hypothetical protein
MAVQRRMAREFDGDAEKIRSMSIQGAARALGMTPRSLNQQEAAAFSDLALVLALIPDLWRWSETEKRKVVEIVRAKAGSDESRYAQLLQNHAKLRAAIIRLGETPLR